MFHAMDLFPYQRVPTASITLYPNHKNYIQESVIKSVMYWLAFRSDHHRDYNKIYNWSYYKNVPPFI